MAMGRKTGGRTKGTPNKVSGTVKDNVIEVFEGIGGIATMMEWAKQNQTEFYRLYARLLTREVAGASDGQPIPVVFLPEDVRL